MGKSLRRCGVSLTFTCATNVHNLTDQKNEIVGRKMPLPLASSLLLFRTAARLWERAQSMEHNPHRYSRSRRGQPTRELLSQDPPANRRETMAASGPQAKPQWQGCAAVEFGWMRCWIFDDVYRCVRRKRVRGINKSHPLLPLTQTVFFTWVASKQANINGVGVGVAGVQSKRVRVGLTSDLTLWHRSCSWSHSTDTFTPCQFSRALLRSWGISFFISTLASSHFDVFPLFPRLSRSQISVFHIRKFVLAACALWDFPSRAEHLSYNLWFIAKLDLSLSR